MFLIIQITIQHLAWLVIDKPLPYTHPVANAEPVVDATYSKSTEQPIGIPRYDCICHRPQINI